MCFRLGFTLALLVLAAPAQVPKTWDDRELADWATPVAALKIRPGHYSELDYYQAPVDNLRTYPVYHPDREPRGYWDSIVRRTSEPLVEPDANRTATEWIRLGRRVFEELDLPTFRSGDPKLLARARSREELAEAGVRPEPDGTIFGLRWVVTPNGVKLGVAECAFCHARRLANGVGVHGAPRNARGNALTAQLVAEGRRRRFRGDALATILFRQFGVPWAQADVHTSLKTLTETELLKITRVPVTGVIARENGSPLYPAKIPDLIGIRDRKYLDHTGTHRHRGVGDLMRYAALITGSDPMEFGTHRLLTPEQRRVPFRYSDETLYALAQYIYSLEPPENPNRRDPRAEAGEKIFHREQCSTCHTPPHYTSNKLTPARGFVPPEDHLQKLDTIPVSVDTDPGLALHTRKGTGYYKIPSLKGVWYRGLYLHDGVIGNLDDLFDPARLRDDYTPTGYAGYGVEKRAVRGHEFGIRLSPEERSQLIAFLRTL